MRNVFTRRREAREFLALEVRTWIAAGNAGDIDREARLWDNLEADAREMGFESVPAAIAALEARGYRFE